MAALVPAREDPRLSEWPAPSHNLTGVVIIIVIIIIIITIVINIMVIIIIIVIYCDDEKDAKMLIRRIVKIPSKTDKDFYGACGAGEHQTLPSLPW